MAVPLERSQPRRLRVTPGMLNEWQECGSRFAFGQRDKHSRSATLEPPSHSLAMGKAVHEVVAHVNRVAVGGRGFPAVEEAVEHAFNPSHFGSSEEAAEARHTARAMVANYCSYVSEQRLMVLAMERFVNTPPVPVADGLEGVLSGKIDVVLRRDDGVLLSTDLKTGTALPRPDALATRLSSVAYHCLTRLLYPKAPAILVSQLLVGTGLAVTVELPENALREGKGKIRELIIALDADPMMMGQAFQPTAGEYCAWCRYQDDCPLFNGESSQAEPAF